jgi:hypothetical protein
MPNTSLDTECLDKKIRRLLSKLARPILSVEINEINRTLDSEPAGDLANYVAVVDRLTWVNKNPFQGRIGLKHTSALLSKGREIHAWWRIVDKLPAKSEFEKLLVSEQKPSARSVFFQQEEEQEDEQVEDLVIIFEQGTHNP